MLIGGANLAALGVLVGLFFGPGGARASRRRGARARSGRASRRRRRAGSRAKSGRVLERDLERIVARWVERARAETKNKVHADNVEVAVHVRELGGGPKAAIALRRDARAAARPRT